MLTVTDSKIIGCSKGEGQRGTFYNVSFMNEGEPYRISCTKEIYELATNCDFGEEKRLVLDLRLYGREWGVRVVDFE